MSLYPRLTVKEKSGFNNTTGNRIVLLDSRGVVFYDTNFKNSPVWRFNLPKGEYFIERGKFTKLNAPIDYPLLPLPDPDRNKRDDPNHFAIEFADNPHKASIDWQAKKITFDDSFKELPLSIVMTVLEHEKAHRYYSSEDACDTLAYNKMIERGYNPSQIALAFLDTIRNRSCEHTVSNIIDKNTNNFDLSDSYDVFNIGMVQMFLKNKNAPTNLWQEPGGKLLKTIPPNGFIGRIEALNSARTWAKVRNASLNDFYGWVSVKENPDIIAAVNFDDEGNETRPSTAKELEDAKKLGEKSAERALMAINPAAGLGKKGLDIIENTAATGLNVLDSLVKITEWLSKNYIFVIIVVLLFVFRNEIKSLIKR